MHSATSTPAPLGQADIATTGPRPSETVTAAWNTMAEAAVCDPPAPPRSVKNGLGGTRRPQGGSRGRWFGEGSAHELFESSPCGILLVTPLGRVIDANPSFLAITGRSWRDVAGGRINAALGLPATSSVLPASPMTLGGAVQIERVCRHRSGQTLDLEITVIPIPDEDATIQGLAVHIVDMTAQREAERRVGRIDELLYAVHHDDVTGLGNRRALTDLDESLAPATVVFADLDLFEAIGDDPRRRAVGDVLAAVAERLEDFADEGIAARWGTSEFVLVLPGQDRNLEQVRRSLRGKLEKPIETSGGTVVVGMGIGVVRSQGGAICTAIERANKRAFMDKRGSETAGSDGPQSRPNLTAG